jgi:hypothetical protein
MHTFPYFMKCNLMKRQLNLMMWFWQVNNFGPGRVASLGLMGNSVQAVFPPLSVGDTERLYQYADRSGRAV